MTFYLGEIPTPFSKQKLIENLIALFKKDEVQQTIITSISIQELYFCACIILIETCTFEILSDKDVFNETVMLSLRTARGLDLAELDQALLAEARHSFDAAIASGNLVPTPEGRLRIPSDRFFISDFAIIGEFL